MLAWWDVLEAALESTVLGRCDQSVYFQNSQKAFNQNTFYECSWKYVVVSVQEISLKWSEADMVLKMVAKVNHLVFSMQTYKHFYFFSTGVFRPCEEALGWWRRQGVLWALQRISTNRLCALVSMSFIIIVNFIWNLWWWWLFVNWHNKIKVDCILLKMQLQNVWYLLAQIKGTIKQHKQIITAIIYGHSGRCSQAFGFTDVLNRISCCGYSVLM